MSFLKELRMAKWNTPNKQTKLSAIREDGDFPDGGRAHCQILDGEWATHRQPLARAEIYYLPMTNFAN